MSALRHVLVDAINDNALPRGPDRYLVSLLTEMARLAPDCRFELCHAPWQAGFLRGRFGPNVETIELRPPRRPVARALWHATVFPTWADGRRADAVFLPNVILAPGLRTPAVMTVHDLAHFRHPEKFGVVKGRLQRVQIRLAVGRARRLVAVSGFTRSDLARFVGIDDERVVEIGEGAPPAVPRTRPPDDPPLFLCVGKVERSKNVEALVTAFAASPVLAALGARLAIVGPAGNAEALLAARMAELGCDRVLRLGFVSEEELRALYAGATAFVFPSLVEGFGLVLLEAMAAGAPVIAMNASAVPEVVGDAGLLVDPADPLALRGAMERLATDPELRDDLSGKGYARVAQFSWTEAARRTLREIEEVAGCS